MKLKYDLEYVRVADDNAIIESNITGIKDCEVSASD